MRSKARVTSAAGRDPAAFDHLRIGESGRPRLDSAQAEMPPPGRRAAEIEAAASNFAAVTMWVLPLAPRLIPPILTACRICDALTFSGGRTDDGVVVSPIENEPFSRRMTSRGLTGRSPNQADHQADSRTVLDEEIFSFASFFSFLAGKDRPSPGSRSRAAFPCSELDRGKAARRRRVGLPPKRAGVVAGGRYPKASADATIRGRSGIWLARPLARENASAGLQTLEARPVAGPAEPH